MSKALEQNHLIYIVTTGNHANKISLEYALLSIEWESDTCHIYMNYLFTADIGYGFII